MSNLPPCGACSYTPAIETLSISISPKFVGVLSDGHLKLVSSTGEEVVHAIPYRLGAGGTAIVKGLTKPAGGSIARATLSWVLSGDPAGQQTVEQAIDVNQ